MGAQGGMVRSLDPGQCARTGGCATLQEHLETILAEEDSTLPCHRLSPPQRLLPHCGRWWPTPGLKACQSIACHRPQRGCSRNSRCTKKFTAIKSHKIMPM